MFSLATARLARALVSSWYTPSCVCVCEGVCVRVALRERDADSVALAVMEPESDVDSVAVSLGDCDAVPVADEELLGVLELVELGLAVMEAVEDMLLVKLADSEMLTLLDGVGKGVAPVDRDAEDEDVAVGDGDSDPVLVMVLEGVLVLLPVCDAVPLAVPLLLAVWLPVRVDVMVCDGVTEPDGLLLGVTDGDGVLEAEARIPASRRAFSACSVSISSACASIVAFWLTIVEVRLSKLIARAPKSGKEHELSSAVASGSQLVAILYVQPGCVEG